MYTFGASGGFGAFDGWDLQSASYSEQSERAQAFSKTGNEADSELYDKRRNWTCNYKANRNYAATAPTIPPEIGAVFNSIVLLQIQLGTTYNDFATMTLTGHEHIDGSDGADMRKVAHTITLDKGFGASTFDTSGGESVESSQCTISCDHAETKDGSGDTSQGENYNPRIELSVTWFGATASLPAGYDETEKNPETENTGFQKAVVNGIKALAFAE